MRYELSIQEIADFSNKLKDMGIISGLPSSKPGVTDRVRSSWQRRQRRREENLHASGLCY